MRQMTHQQQLMIFQHDSGPLKLLCAMVPSLLLHTSVCIMSHCNVLLAVRMLVGWRRWQQRLAEYAPASSASSNTSACPMGSPGQEASALPSRARRYMPFMDGQYVLSTFASPLRKPFHCGNTSSGDSDAFDMICQKQCSIPATALPAHAGVLPRPSTQYVPVA